MERTRSKQNSNIPAGETEAGRTEDPMNGNKKSLQDLLSEIAELRLACEDLKRSHEILKTQLDGQRLFIETLRIPGNICVEAVADDLAGLGAVLFNHEHNEEGKIRIPPEMLTGNYRIRCLKTF